MESWKSGSQMTRTIDLRHWAHRGDIVPRCRDRTFSALEGSVPMTVPFESESGRGSRRRHTSIRGAMFRFLGKGPGIGRSQGLPRPLGRGGLDSLSGTHPNKSH